MIVKPPWRAAEATDASSPLPLDARFRFTAPTLPCFSRHGDIFALFHVSGVSVLHSGCKASADLESGKSRDRQMCSILCDRPWRKRSRSIEAIVLETPLVHADWRLPNQTIMDTRMWIWDKIKDPMLSFCSFIVVIDASNTSLSRNGVRCSKEELSWTRIEN